VTIPQAIRQMKQHTTVKKLVFADYGAPGRYGVDDFFEISRNEICSLYKTSHSLAEAVGSETAILARAFLRCTSARPSVATLTRATLQNRRIRTPGCSRNIAIEKNLRACRLPRQPLCGLSTF
jgi:hypothetical protein